MADKKPNRTAPSTQKIDFVLAWIVKISSAANVELSEQTQAVYLEYLMRLTDEQLACAGRLTIEEWTEPSKMPPIPFIVERAGRLQEPFINDARRILDRGDKPPDWDPEFAKEFLAKLRDAAQSK